MNEIVKTSTHWIQCIPPDKEDISLNIAERELDVTISKNMIQPNIATVRKDFPIRDIVRIIRGIILYSAKTFKYAENMNLQQATVLASDLVDNFKDECLDDIVLMFKMARQGKLGETKGRLDADSLFNIIAPNYRLYKAEIREKQYSKEKFSHRNDNDSISDDAYAKFTELSERLSMNRTQQKEQNPPPVNHHKIYTDKLKASVGHMDLTKLKKLEQKLISQSETVFNDAIKIVQAEISKRK